MGLNNTKPEIITAARLTFVLARASASIKTYIERSFAQQDFCFTDFMILEALLHLGPLTISTIGEKVTLASASMTSAIDRLEQRGLVQRTLDAEDRRVRLVALTCEGRKLIERIFVQHLEDMEAITKDISQQERQVLYTALKKIGFAAKAATPPIPSHSSSHASRNSDSNPA